jgi:putative transcriptional regulator
MKKELLNELTESLAQMGRIRKGAMRPSRVFTYPPVDAKRIRNKLHASQAQFAMMLGVSKSTLQNWEQGRREPDGSARALLRVAERHPEAVLEALHAS